MVNMIVALAFSVIFGVLAVLLARPPAQFLTPFVFLKRDEQLLMETLSDKEVRNGPGSVVFVPFVTRATKRNAILLDELEYIVVTDTLTGVQRVQAGPQLFFMEAYDSVGESKNKIVLEKGEYVKILESKTGDLRTVQGPTVVVPQPTETISEGKQSAVSLGVNEYVRLTDSSTGKVRLERGEKLVFPQPMEMFHDKQDAFKLKKNQYVKLLDKATGVVRVAIGEQIVFPTATEEAYYETVQEAVNVDVETAALVVSTETGQQRLVTQQGLFFPGAYDEVVEVRKLIRVEPHEVAIVQDNQGVYHFHNGTAGGKGTAFFLPPYHTLVTMNWSSATSPEDLAANLVKNLKTVAYKVPVTKIDLRAQYAFFEYTVRTKDNVELTLEGTIFWQVVDVPKMMERTGDPKGDVWYHARSSLIQAISNVTLEQFMSGFNTMVTKAATMDEDFYSARGVRLHNLEVTRYECKDSSTAAVLQEIIQESTNRINRLQQQHSQNEVQRDKMAGDIELEKQRVGLLEAKTQNDRILASVQGEAEGLRLAKSAEAFFSLLNQSIPDPIARIELFKFFAEQQTSTKQTESLAGGNATLFLTPQDMKLKLQMPSPVKDGAASGVAMKSSNQAS